MKEVRVKAPVRIDLAGGWTDCAPFSHDHGGEVVNVAINQYIKASFKIDDDDLISVHYESEVPGSSGLGTSAAMNVAFLSAISGEGRSPSEIAELAYQFEALLGNRGGRQDQWAAAGGGIQHLMFAGESVEILPFEPLPSAKRWLQRQMILAYTGISHVSGDIHQGVWDRYDAGDEVVMESLMVIRKAARQLADGLQKDRRDEVIFAMRSVTEAIENMAPELNAPYRGVVDALMESRDILAWKGMGAAGGGCIGMFANIGTEDEVKRVCEEAGWSIIDWQIDEEGLVRETTEN